MSGRLTGLQLGGLLRQRLYAARLGQPTNAISLDGGVTWWEFYLEEAKDFAIGGPVDADIPAREEWNPLHAGLRYSVIEVKPGTRDALLVVRFGFEGTRYFAFKVRKRPIQLVIIDAEGEMRDAGPGNGETLDKIEYLGLAEVVCPRWCESFVQELR